MKRRAFLATALATTAGCITRPGRAGPPTGTTNAGSTQTTVPPTDSGTTSTTQASLDGTRSVSVASVSQESLGDLGLSANVSLPTVTVTSAHPAQIRVTLAASHKTTVSHRICRPGDLHEATASDGTTLVLKEGRPETSGTSDCWRISHENLWWGRPCYSTTTTITPDTPYTRTYTLWNHPENASCFPSGTYHVRDAVERDGTTYAWSFDLDVAKGR